MKKISVLILFCLAGCGTQPIPSTQLKFETLAKQYLRDYKADCVKEGSKTWGRSLCVPMMIIDRDKMQAFTSEPDPEGKFKKTEDVYTGTYYGEPVYANTSIQWGGRSWSMVLWPLADDRIERTHLMFHEAFHSIQSELGFPMNGAFNDHLDQEQARVLIRLEWNALFRALTDEKQRKDHLVVALQLRNLRFSRFTDAKKNEEALEISEGLAEYTGTKLRGSSQADTYKYLNQRLQNVPKIVSLTRSSAYYSGALYGLLLDTQETDWKSRFARNRNFTKTSEEVFNVRVPKKVKQLQTSVLDQYGNSDIVRFEHQRAVETQAKVAKYLKQINQTGKVKINLQNPMGMFNPYGILSVSRNEIIYITYDLRDVWGTLVVTDGAYLKKDEKTASVSVSPPTEFTDTTAEGKEWDLKLNSGWKFVKRKTFFTVEKI